MMPAKTTIQPAPDVELLKLYSVPGHPAPISLRLSANEGPRPPSSLMAQCGDVDRMRCYPTTDALERRIAERLGVEARRVLVTAGADDALARAIRAVAAPGRDVISTVPTFEMIEHFTRLVGARPVQIPWMDGDLPLVQICDAIDERTAAVVVVSPNNPTGAIASASRLNRLLASCPNVLVIVDQVYVEYTDEDPTSMVLRHPNGLLVRSFSKAWGMAGLRIGYATGAAEVLQWMRAIGPPYAVSAPALSAALNALLGDDGWMRRHVRRIQRERVWLYDLLVELGQRPWASEANFVLAAFEDAAWVADALAGMGIAVRRFPQASPLSRCLRITCPGDGESWSKLEHALRTALAPQALIFDMDGVLADTSRSYREAIRATARHFGVELAPGEIVRAKAAGDANDDWALTRRLLSDHGRCVPLEAVIERFEELYQGDAGRPGLRNNEGLLPPIDLLEVLARRLPLAVVTGRPLADARRFLAEKGIDQLFATVVAREDAPLKPDPAPVSLALDRLGVRRAWMVGDTPDDVIAARGAGVLPLGVLPPDDDTRIGEAQLAAGAARVLPALESLLEILS